MAKLQSSSYVGLDHYGSEPFIFIRLAALGYLRVNWIVRRLASNIISKSVPHPQVSMWWVLMYLETASFWSWTRLIGSAHEYKHTRDLWWVQQPWLYYSVTDTLAWQVNISQWEKRHWVLIECNTGTEMLKAMAIRVLTTAVSSWGIIKWPVK